jgi:hypothetical protein
MQFPIKKLLAKFGQSITYKIADTTGTTKTFQAVVSEYPQPTIMGVGEKLKAIWCVFTIDRDNIDYPSTSDKITFDDKIYEIVQIKPEQNFTDVVAKTA